MSGGLAGPDRPDEGVPVRPVPIVPGVAQAILLLQGDGFPQQEDQSPAGDAGREQPVAPRRDGPRVAVGRAGSGPAGAPGGSGNLPGDRPGEVVPEGLGDL